MTRIGNVRVVTITTCGPRPENQDAVRHWVCPTSKVAGAVIADGVGGHPYGRQAARITARTVLDRLSADLDHPDAHIRAEVHAAISAANDEVILTDWKDRRARLLPPASTVAVAVHDPTPDNHDAIHVAWLGDSRVYLGLPIPDSPAVAVVHATEDHGYGGVFVTRAVGLDPQPEIEQTTVTVPSGSPARILLTTDGIHDLVDLDTIVEAFNIPDSQQAADHLMHAAIGLELVDNATLAILDINHPR